ncbi:MAG: putative pyridoxal-dependent aspartate 1-decarboxylase [Desulfotignum sp.]|nr:putative pyridoxal-dependent aspartate 1-decarboxylase [Desulfotignum sp.]
MNNLTTPGKIPIDLVADWHTLHRVFIRPEDEKSRQTLIKYMEQILFGLHDFLNTHVGVTEAIPLATLAQSFTDTTINREPEKKLADVIQDIINQIAPRAVNVASPYFIGHMTSAIPFFMVHLKAIAAALNQNLIKLETSKVLSVLEKQVLAKIHRMIYSNSQTFYDTHVQNANTCLGLFTNGGTTANITALWVARNRCLPATAEFSGVEQDGMAAAMTAHDLEQLVVLVSERGHYSLKKAGGVLGIGNKNVIAVKVNKHQQIDMAELTRQVTASAQNKKIRIAAIVGIAGATETGTIDPLPEMARLCRTHGIHFHVDAAWGGPVMLSEKYAGLLDGISQADSVTIDCHKQFYMPMSAGMVFFKDPTALDRIIYHAGYVNRKGSVDLGIKTLEGSREASSLILDSALKIMGSRGYALMIEHGIETARLFAEKIRKRDRFQLVTEPILNILTYRAVPPALKQLLNGDVTPARRQAVDTCLDRINTDLQRIQREAGKSFVSRTCLKIHPDDAHTPVVLRSVIMNPYTDGRVLDQILDEQETILQSPEILQHQKIGFMAPI